MSETAILEHSLALSDTSYRSNSRSTYPLLDNITAIVHRHL